MKTWNALLVDDEAPARERLRRLLGSYPFVHVAGEAANGASALDLITELEPELLFLDIEMPVLNGFELLQKLTSPPKVIFTTAYDQYAVKAFEEESVDYLLKPVTPERLEKAMKKLQQLEPKSDFQLPLNLLMQQLGTRKELKTLTVKLGDRIILVKLADVIFIEAEDKYVFLQTADGRRHLTDFTLAGLETRLPDAFIRISRSVIVNMDQLTEMRKGFNGAFVFVMNGGAKLTSGRSYGSDLRNRFDL